MSTTHTPTIAIDMYGGDHGLQSTLGGVIYAATTSPDVDFLLFGNKTEIETAIAEGHPEWEGMFRIVDAVEPPKMVTPSSLRNAHTSIGMAIESVADQTAEAVVSAGDTRLLMSLSVHALGCVSHIKRPAIAAVLPTSTGRILLLDVGASTDRGAEALVKNAVMGMIAGASLLGSVKPSFAFLNLGTERDKGPEELRRAVAIIEHLGELPGRLTGFVEGFVLSEGGVDVVITDGFTGNIALKSFQGTYAWVRHKTKAVLPEVTHENIDGALELDSYNGAPLLGVRGLVVKSHGSANAAGFGAAIVKAILLARGDFTSRFEKTMNTIGIRA